ncbi:MAG: bifunctional diaminohydroxyphosphoribosylaminopyrimidine deaminase/5-amino-6-(5-phosphoribosylamino)uracil reductase RibD [Verrucomicrobiota bacterium]|nr:bifunctional diaminohydroxyphosphoribosylaminopyrimidine deaminase/5-amino-6-(5-phosphoribosylamino)uracil reductase RibD [Verrucomicrobiota bacterium]
MRVALNEARKALGRTSPNPAVGALLLVRNEIIARGHHRHAGAAHAELECIRQLKGAATAGSTLYVTLEPCSTSGRTPPCTDEIIRAGIQTVVIGTIDVNPRHRGRGIALLQQAGIKVRVGVLADECAGLNEGFNKWIVTGRPFVIAKCGMSLDGRLTRPPGEVRWITNASARRDAQRLRAQVDAILVGARTVRADNPRLTVRGTRGGRQPWRVVLTLSGNLPKQARLFRDRFAERTVVYRRQSLRSVLEDLGRKEVTSVLIEGGGEILGQALDAGLIDKVQLYLAPILTGGAVIAFAGNGVSATQAAARLERGSFSKFGDNICITGYPRFRASE